MKIKAKKSELEPAASALTALGQCLRPGTLAARFGEIKGAIQPMAEGAYYDREALIDEHAIFVQEGEGEKLHTVRWVEPFLVKGEKVGESVIMKDQRAFNVAQRELMNQEVEIVVPFLIEEKHINEIEKNAPKDPMKSMPFVDFAALRIVRVGTAQVVPE